MPPKVRELVANLKRAGFVNRGGKGSHRNFVHPNVSKPVVLSGNLGDDAKPYQAGLCSSRLRSRVFTHNRWSLAPYFGTVRTILLLRVLYYAGVLPARLHSFYRNTR